MMVWICRKCVKCKKVQSRKQLEGCLQKWRVIGENARSSYLFRNKQANLHEQRPTAVATLASEAMTTMAQDTADGAKTVPFASCERDWLSHSPSTSCKSERVPFPVATPHTRPLVLLESIAGAFRPSHSHPTIPTIPPIPISPIFRAHAPPPPAYTEPRESVSAKLPRPLFPAKTEPIQNRPKSRRFPSPIPSRVGELAKEPGLFPRWFPAIRRGSPG